MSRLLKEEIFMENNKRRNVTMNKYLIFYIILLFLSSCNKVITGRVDKIQYTPWKGGNVLMYKTSFCKDGKMDSTYLIGNRIYVKGTYNSFYFEVGDSINIKLGLTEYQNKFISIHKLVKRGNTFVEKRTKTIGSSIKIVGISAATSTAILYGCSSKGTSSSSSASAEGEIPTDKMTYRTSPTTGDRVSLLGYGCMRWPLKPSPDGKGEVIDQDAVNGLIDYAIAHGVNYFDTSPAYVQGFSEKSTGIALSRYPRDKYFIATKLSNFSPDTWSREASLKMYHKSFADLQVDYIDYMLLHGIGMGGMDALKGRYLDNGMLDFLIKEREAGRIRNLGFSYHGDIEVYDYLLSRHDEIKWDFVQIQLNYVDWKHAKETNTRNTDAEYLYGELHKRGIPSIIMEPLLGGRLSKLNDNLVARLKQRRPESSVASWAFRFAGTFPDILTVLSGMTYMEHLQDNLRTYSPLEPLTDEEMDFLEDTAQLMLKYPTIPCNDCKYCMPCPYGLDIPAVLLHYNRCVNEGNVPKNGQDENYVKARRAFLVGYDRSVPKLRQASHCIGCNQCVPHCPQNIDIPKELHRIDQFVEQLKQGTL